MTTRLSGADIAILSAQCAFIRDERRTQRHHRHLFMYANAAPTPRLTALTALIDLVTDETLERLRALPSWSQVAPVVRTHLELLTEAALRGAMGCDDGAIRMIEGVAAEFAYTADGSPLTSAGDEHWAMSGLCYLITCPRRGAVVWPIVIPHEIAHGAVTHVEAV